VLIYSIAGTSNFRKTLEQRPPSQRKDGRKELTRPGNRNKTRSFSNSQGLEEWEQGTTKKWYQKSLRIEKVEGPFMYLDHREGEGGWV